MRYVAAIGLVLVVGMALEPVTAAQKGTVNYTYADSITFRDAASPADGVVSDGAPYFNGIDGAIKIFTGGSGDLTVGLSTRTMTAFTVAPVKMLGSPFPTSATPTTTLGVVNIWGIAIGTTATRSAAFGHATGNISFGDHNDGAGAYSTQVNVQRLSKTEWIVTTDGTNALAVYSTQVRRKATFTAEYVLPFQIDVICSLCQ